MELWNQSLQTALEEQHTSRHLKGKVTARSDYVGSEQRGVVEKRKEFVGARSHGWKSPIQVFLHEVAHLT